MNSFSGLDRECVMKGTVSYSPLLTIGPAVTTFSLAIGGQDMDEKDNNAQKQVVEEKSESQPVEPLTIEVETQEAPSPAELLEKARAEARESYERMLRIAADFENYKKRNERERVEFIKFANEKLLRELLPIADNLERALDAARKANDAPNIAAGVELVLQEFRNVLKKFGVEPIVAVGCPFDPSLHEAYQQIESEDHAPGTVLFETQKGYTIHGRLLRPSLVAVATAPEVTTPGNRTIEEVQN